jgi:hypothetical protein
VSAPPTDISAAELYLKLSEPKPSEVFDWPRNGPDGKPVRRVRVQVLSMKEHELARIEGHRKIKKTYGLKSEDMSDAIIREVAGDAVARELIAMACVHVEPAPGTEHDEERGPRYPRMFRDADHVSELTAHEVLVLFNAYILTQDKFGPFERSVESEADVDRWIKRLEEGGSEFPLLSLSLPQLVTLAFSLAARTSSLYRALATQWESLPDSSKSTLRDFSETISFYGSAPDEPEESGSESLPEPVLTTEHELSIDDAKAMALRLRNPTG